MALDQALFKEDRMRKLMKDIKDIEDHTNNLRTSMNGFSNQLDSQLISRISSEISQAQTLINTLTSKVEHMSEFLQFAIKKITETEQVNTNDAKALKQASTKENIWGSLAQSVAGTVKKMADAIGHIASTITHTNPLSLFLAPIPTVLAAVAKELKLQIEGTNTEIWLGALTNDNQVNFLLGKIAEGTPGEQKWAKDQLEQILQAFSEIGRCQVAYGMYAKYNNQTYMEGAHRQAVIERERLLKLGVAASYFNDDVDLTALYQNAALLACNYNPLKTDYSEMPTDNQMRFLILTAVKKDKDGEWALGQLRQIEALLQEIGTAQKAYKKLKAIGQLDKLDGGHQKAENARTKLKEMYRLAPESVDDIDFERYGTDPIIGGVQGGRMSNGTSESWRSDIANEAAYWEGKIPYCLDSVIVTQTLDRNHPPKYMDCADFTSSVYKTILGIDIGQNTKKQITRGKEVDYSELKVGDLIFFDWKSNGKGVDHVGIYIGDGKFIHETGNNADPNNLTNPKENVRINNLNDDWGGSYGIIKNNICSIRRVIQDDQTYINDPEVGRIPLPSVSSDNLNMAVSVEQLNLLGWNHVTEDMAMDLNRVLVKYEINTPERIRHFISQTMKESNKGLWLTEAAWCSIEVQKEYCSRYDNRLGNKGEGEGFKYRGAGFIQLTGRDNYQAFADAVGDQEIVNQGADYVVKHYAWEAAASWWKNNKVNAVIDRGTTVSEITLKVNPGLASNPTLLDKEVKERGGFYNQTVSAFK